MPIVTAVVTGIVCGVLSDAMRRRLRRHLPQESAVTAAIREFSALRTLTDPSAFLGAWIRAVGRLSCIAAASLVTLFCVMLPLAAGFRLVTAVAPAFTASPVSVVIVSPPQPIRIRSGGESRVLSAGFHEVPTAILSAMTVIRSETGRELLRHAGPGRRALCSGWLRQAGLLALGFDVAAVPEELNNEIHWLVIRPKTAVMPGLGPWLDAAEISFLTTVALVTGVCALRSRPLS